MSMIIGTIASSRRAGSSFESISSTAGAGSNTVTFSGIPSTYKHLQLRVFTNNTDANSLNLRMNSDTGTNYIQGQVEATGNTRTSGHSQSGTITGIFLASLLNATNFFCPIIVDIHDYTSTSKMKTVRINAGRVTSSAGTNRVYSSSGAWLNTNAVTSLTVFVPGTNFFANSVFALYGIKGA